MIDSKGVGHGSATQEVSQQPEGVTYLQVAFERTTNGIHSIPATVVIDRISGRLYIHQEW